MRFALLFAVRLLIPAMVMAYVLAMLASSCLPVADATGEVQAIPRWEYWLLHASVPSAIWWQWTGGLQPVVIADRIPILVLASIWMMGCLWAGTIISRFDPLSSRLSKYERVGISILIGQSVLSVLVFLCGTLFGTASLVWLLILAVAVVVWQFRLGSFETTTAVIDRAPGDTTFASSIGRRMVGLLFLATVYLGCVQVYGSTIPTQDMHVREVNWWIVKHAALDGRIGLLRDHTMAKGPAGFEMAAVLFSSVLSCMMPEIATDKSASLEGRERWNQHLRTSVLAGKTVNAMLSLAAVLLASIHLSRRWGILAALFVSLVLLSTPGIAELSRLGRTEALIGIWGVGLLVIWQAWSESGAVKSSTGLLWAFLLAGAFSSGYAAAVLVGLPAAVTGLAIRFAKPRLSGSNRKARAAKALFVGSIVAASAFFVRNLIVDGDPISPWGRVVLQQITERLPSSQVDALLHAYRIPAETVQESIAAASFETTTNLSSELQSPYRISNALDGILRLLGNSNVHGLMLIPFAIVGCLFGNFRTNRIATIWVLYWMLIWWGFSTRQDRDWVGALFLLSWPTAIGAKWIASQARGYYMFILVLIAIIWSVVVIPIWPTSDNRILVSLDAMGHAAANFDGSNDSEKASDYLTFSHSLNESIRRSDSFKPHSKILLVGENDDFDLLADCVSNGPFDEGLFDKLLVLPTQEMGGELRNHGISHLFIVWTGVRYRGRLTGKDRENEYRVAITKMLNDSQLRSIALQMNSSQAELFLLNEK